MLRIDRTGRKLSRLVTKLIPDAGIKERSDIQQMIRNSPEEFFAEIGEPLLLLAEELCPTEVVDDRIDLLALDEEGAVVVIEIKRGSHKLQLLQALTYAATIAEWGASDLLEQRCQLVSQSAEEVREEVEEFLTETQNGINTRQRIMLLAEDFDFMVLATAEWLSEKHGIDIRCYRLSLSEDAGVEYLSCTCIFPPPELAQEAARRRPLGTRGARKPSKWTDWKSALESVENPALVEFF